MSYVEGKGVEIYNYLLSDGLNRSCHYDGPGHNDRQSSYG